MRKFILLSNIINTDSMFLRHCLLDQAKSLYSHEKTKWFLLKTVRSQNYLLKTFNMWKVFKIKDKWVNDQMSVD